MSLPLADHSHLAESPSLIELDETFLPIGRMRQIARVISVQGETIAGEVDLDPYHWVWTEHFPGDPIFPGTLLIEAAGQLLALWAWAQGTRGRPRLVRTTAVFHNPVGLHATHLRLEARVRAKRHLYFGSIQVSYRDVAVASVEAVLTVLPPISVG
jgi:3-hydroxymyristoyl/3-hydroxydecanoyl-(acyl carrier protein) dehydratase